MDLIDSGKVTKTEARLLLLGLMQKSSSTTIQHNNISHDFEVSYETFKKFVKQLNVKIEEAETAEKETLQELQSNYQEAGGNAVSFLFQKEKICS
jgi:hypothetical protein